MAPSELSRLCDQIEQLIRAGQWSAAEQTARHLLELAPDSARAWACAGAVHLQFGRMPEAESSFRQATALNGQDAAAWHHLSLALHGLGHLEEAEAAGRQAVAIDGSQPAFLLQLGNVLFAEEKFADAEDAFGRCVAASPLDITAWNFLAAAQHVQKKWAAAQRAYESSLAIAPQQLETRLKLADVLERSMSFSAAERLAFDLAAEHAQSAEVWSLLGRVQLALGKQAEAIGSLRGAIEIEPTPQGHSRLLQAMQYEEFADPETLLAEHREWDRRYAAILLASPPTDHSGSQLRIGIVSADLGQSPVAHMVLPGLRAIDKQRCFIAYYFDSPVEDHVTPRFRQTADLWRVIYGQSDQVVADQIRADEIDVLIDLMGHVGNRLLVFARKPAPVQISWFGYVGTTGMQAMDYLLADRFHIRPGEESLHVETVLRMPHSYACYGAPDYAPAVGELPALRTGQVTFGCFNNPAKWTPRILYAWSEILRQAAGARLLLKYRGLHDAQTQDYFRAQFAVRGIEPHRIALEGWSDHRELLDAYNRVDIALDTQPYSGGVTTCEALWMGVPVVTFPGATFAGRHATSDLSNAGCEAFIGHNVAEYIRLADDWSRRVDELAALRATMRGKFRHSPLCDAERFADDFVNILAAVCKRP